MKKFLSRVYNHLFYPLKMYFQLRLAIIYYNIRVGGIKKRIKKKNKIKVVFFPINIGMWKNDFLFRLFQNDPRFEPVVISFLVPVDKQDFQQHNQEEMQSFFRERGYSYYNMYDFVSGKWLNIKEIRPDMVFYAQPVNVGYKDYCIQALWKDALFYYIPYCMGMEDEKKGYNTLLFNICSKVFAPSFFHKKFWSSYFYNKGKNIVVTGYPSFDYLTIPAPAICHKWKCNDRRKRVIWAPHHTVASSDHLTYSNFLLIADTMIELAKKYKDTIEFVFKPHPRLRPKLEKLPTWGSERTEAYYKQWEEMPNTNFVDGDYFDLFMSSDAMIHDCSTFMAEYLFTGNPVMFLLRENSTVRLNEYAKKCYEHHYIGHNLNEIEFFIENVVLNGDDPMKSQRLNFVETSLKQGDGDTVAEKIFYEIKRDLI
jgi:hypothetical protein